MIIRKILTNEISTKTTTDQYSVKVVLGTEIETLIQFLLQQRLEFYRAYPYLYEGKANLKRAKEYITWLAKLPHTALVVAYHDEAPIGFCWGTPLVDFDEHVEGSVDTFKKSGLKPESYYYISDLIVIQEHATDEVYRKLLKVFEGCAQSFGYTELCLAEKNNENSHPLKPINYQSNDQMLLNNNFVKTSLYATFNWQTLQVDGSIKNEEHKLVYWIKQNNVETL